jgi:hypothetical protein
VKNVYVVKQLTILMSTNIEITIIITIDIRITITKMETIRNIIIKRKDITKKIIIEEIIKVIWMICIILIEDTIFIIMIDLQ